MLGVFMLFMIPVGGGIPAGVLLAAKHGFAWPLTAALYLVSDVVLAFLFEPVMLLLVALGRRLPLIARVTAALRASTSRAAANYGGAGTGPFTLVMIAFGVDPMTGRTAAYAAGHGFLTGWAIAIAGDMLYFGLVMAVTLKLSSVVKNPEGVVAIVLLAMILLPALARRLKTAYAKA